MENNENIIDRYAIPDLLGKNFFIPDYQRGYRWDKKQIFQLLSDLYLFFKPSGKGSFYCLQPVIVKKCDPKVVAKYELNSEYDDNTWYEVIDGQQRLTTIALILKFGEMLLPMMKAPNPFKLFYQTRPELHKVFDSFSYDPSNKTIVYSATKKLDIDSFFIKKGLESICEWFSKPGAEFEERADTIGFIDFWGHFIAPRKDNDKDASKSVQVIWYELRDGSNPRDVFKRLNDNKIALTNSELIRALFLSQSSEYQLENNLIVSEENKELALRMNRIRKQGHINEQWDTIEHSLRNQDFWAFATNHAANSYSCRIEYLFDLISQKGLSEKAPYGLQKSDPLYTYLFFDRELSKSKIERKSEGYLWALWQKVESYYSTLVYWYENRDYYHWIGYLVYVLGDNVLIELMRDVNKQGKDTFKKNIIDRIFDTVNLAYETLQYTNSKDYWNIEKILLLYNIETYRRNTALGPFPFLAFRNESWSLEHIHAQNSEGLPQDDNNALLKWLDENIEGLKKFKLRFSATEKDEIDRVDKLIADLENTRSKGQKQISAKEVTDQFDKVLSYFNSFCAKRNLPSKIHEFANLTLLGGEANTSVGKSAFEIKRQKIVKMDAAGDFIPYCTKKVFMKYCNIEKDDFEVQQTSCWNDTDKYYYQQDIIKTMDQLREEKNGQ